MNPAISLAFGIAFISLAIGFLEALAIQKLQKEVTRLKGETQQ